MGVLSCDLGFNNPARTPGLASNTETEWLFKFGHIDGLEKTWYKMVELSCALLTKGSEGSGIGKYWNTGMM